MARRRWTAGERTRQIQLQRREVGQDPSGMPNGEWVAVGAPIWANAMGASGMASIRQSSSQDGVARSLNSYSFRIRYRPAVTADMRLVCGGEIFDIKQVRHDLAERLWTDLVCEQGADDG